MLKLILLLINKLPVVSDLRLEDCRKLWPTPDEYLLISLECRYTAGTEYFNLVFTDGYQCTGKQLYGPL